MILTHATSFFGLLHPVATIVSFKASRPSKHYPSLMRSGSTSLQGAVTGPRVGHYPTTLSDRLANPRRGHPATSALKLPNTLRRNGRYARQTANVRHESGRMSLSLVRKICAPRRPYHPPPFIHPARALGRV